MKKNRNIQIVLDLTMSMKDTIGMVYVFLYELLSLINETKGGLVTFQLTWFSGDAHETVKFENDKIYTDKIGEFFNKLKSLPLKKGKSKESKIKDALLASMQNAEGEPGQQVVFLFTDYHLDGRCMIDLYESRGVNRVFLFVPKNQGTFYRFKIVDKNNVVQKLMPVLAWNLELLEEAFSEEDMEYILGNIG